LGRMRFVIKLLELLKFINCLNRFWRNRAKLSYTAMCNFVMPDFFQVKNYFLGRMKMCNNLVEQL